MFELELSTEAGGISYINRESTPITEHLFICSRPGEVRHTVLPYRCYYIHFMLKEGTLCDILEGCPHYTELSEQRYAEYKRIFEGLCTHSDTGLLRDRMIQQSLLLELLCLLGDIKAESISHEPRKSNHERAIHQTLDYIHTHLTADLSLSALAARASFSPIHFHNCFRAATGRTLRDYVEEQRIKHAISLLVRTERTLSEIAYECGFSSQAYFNYAFKRRMKATPREYAATLLSRYEHRESTK
jgi:AraC-like DNA-binding protein